MLMDVSTAGTYLHLINRRSVYTVGAYAVSEQLFTVAMYVQSLHVCLQ